MVSVIGIIQYFKMAVHSGLHCRSDHQSNIDQSIIAASTVKYAASCQAEICCVRGVIGNRSPCLNINKNVLKAIYQSCMQHTGVDECVYTVCVKVCVCVDMTHNVRQTVYGHRRCVCTLTDHIDSDSEWQQHGHCTEVMERDERRDSEKERVGGRR